MHAIIKHIACIVITIECKDDSNWTDNKLGDGNLRCADMNTDWCENYGDYSTEAKEFCPSACGVCSGIQNMIVIY